MKTIGIFCGSSEGILPVYAEKARELGKIIANKSIDIIYGAGKTGIMGHFAESVIENKGNITGIVPDFLMKKEVCNKDIDKTIITNSMFDRKSLMLQKCDSYIAMPGGLGTFDEILEVMVHIQLEQISSPIGLLNIEGYFDHFIQQLDHSVAHKFMKQDHRDCLIIDNDPLKLIEKMEQFTPIDSDPNWIENLKMTNKY